MSEPIAVRINKDSYDELRAEWKRSAAERHERERAERCRYASLRTAATGFARKAMDLHAPVGDGTQWYMCGSCVEGEAYDRVEWPCPTAALALEESE